jgi:hypothetical protein
MAWIEMAAYTSHVGLCMWSGFATDARRDSETGHLTCPKCRTAVTTWKVDQDKEMTALRQEQALIKAQWWQGHQERENALSTMRVQSETAKMRARATADVIARRGGGRYADEGERHFPELIGRAIAEREGRSDG